MRLSELIKLAEKYKKSSDDWTKGLFSELAQPSEDFVSRNQFIDFLETFREYVKLSSININGEPLDLSNKDRFYFSSYINNLRNALNLQEELLEIRSKFKDNKQVTEYVKSFLGKEGEFHKLHKAVEELYHNCHKIISRGEFANEIDKLHIEYLDLKEQVTEFLRSV